MIIEASVTDSWRDLLSFIKTVWAVYNAPKVQVVSRSHRPLSEIVHYKLTVQATVEPLQLQFTSAKRSIQYPCPILCVYLFVIPIR